MNYRELFDIPEIDFSARLAHAPLVTTRREVIDTPLDVLKPDVRKLAPKKVSSVSGRTVSAGVDTGLRKFQKANCPNCHEDYEKVARNSLCPKEGCRAARMAAAQRESRKRKHNGFIPPPPVGSPPPAICSKTGGEHEMHPKDKNRVRCSKCEGTYMIYALPPGTVIHRQRMAKRYKFEGDDDVCPMTGKPHYTVGHGKYRGQKRIICKDCRRYGKPKQQSEAMAA